MTTPEYSHRQIIYALNSISNIPSGRRGNAAKLEGETEDLINDIFCDQSAVKLIGEWKLVWGPQIFEAKKKCFNKESNVADNAMYVAQSVSNPSEFVVAISGTNLISEYGWFVEDFKISDPQPWKYGKEAKSAGKITYGTRIGMNALLGLQDDDHTLFKFLEKQVSNSENPLSVTVTGHSLGGALSPVIALALKDNQGVTLDNLYGWDLHSTTKISVMPTAGPTPGDTAWAKYYDNRIGHDTDRVWNKIDIVPHAWEISMLQQIPTIYGHEIVLPKDSIIHAIVKGAVKKSCHFANKEGSSPLVQIRPDVEGLHGTFNTCPDYKKFLKQALYQHVGAYDALLGTTEFAAIKRRILKENTPTKHCSCFPWK